MFSKPRTIANIKGCLLNQVILKDSQPCIINYLTNLKEIIDFMF